MKKKTVKTIQRKSLVVLGVFVLNGLLPSLTFAGQGSDDGYAQSFTITGYYSPLPNQQYYVTGSYEAEIRLNGKGTHAADGTPVYPGMMAAPGNFNYGTKICLPDFGCGMIHDRGQAIVEKGERNLAKHTRLDLWLGYGDEGLLRALQWGVRHLDGTVHSPESDVRVAVNFKVPLALAQILDIPDKEVFAESYDIGQSDEDVLRLKTVLKQLSWYDGVVDDVFDSSLEQSLLAFQIHHAVVHTHTSVGAGRFGPKTRQAVSDVHYEFLVQQELVAAWDEFHFEKTLKRGVRNADVFKLQQVLVEEEHLEVYPTGFFGPKTQAALTEFQLERGMIDSSYSAGAGHMGPQTMEALNVLLEEKNAHHELALDEARTYVKVQNTFKAWADVPATSLYAFNIQE